MKVLIQLQRGFSKMKGKSVTYSLYQICSALLFICLFLKNFDLDNNPQWAVVFSL